MIKCNCCGRENSNYAIYCEGCGSLLSTVSDSTDVRTDAADGYTSEPAPEPETTSSGYTSTENTYQSEPVQSGEYIPPEYTYDPNPQITTGMEYDGLCIAGFICSICGLPCCGLPSVIGIILCIIGLIRAKTNGKKGAGLAVAGIIIASIILLVYLIVLVANNGSSYSYYSSGRHH